MAQQHTANKHKRMLSTQDYKTLSLSAFGGALEFYDFIIFCIFFQSDWYFIFSC